MYQLHPPRRQCPGGPEFVTDCGGDVWANSNTSCPFAQNVHEQWLSEERGEGAMIQVYSPVTGQTYAMNCVRGAGEVTCRGGNNAAVWFAV
jgi:serine/threonine-protein kinase